jgi:hypothetical protein
VFEDGDKEVDSDGRGFDATLVAIALGDDGIGLLSIASSCCCPATRPSSTSATGVNRWALGGEAFDLPQGAPGEAADGIVGRGFPVFRCELTLCRIKELRSMLLLIMASLIA